MSESKVFAPIVGQTYKNRSGFIYRCIDACKGHFTFISTVGWLFNVSGVRMYDDNCIDWDYSYGGRFDSGFAWI